MRYLLMLVTIAAPVAVFTNGCATDVPDDQDTSTDSGIVPGISSDARLTGLAYFSLPETRPYEATVPLGGDILVGGRFRGNGWDLSFAPGAVNVSSDAQPIISSQTAASDYRDISQVWSTAGFTSAVKAGSDPEADDVFSLVLTAHSVASNGEAGPDASDVVQLKLDNTPPIARITRICTDLEGTDCFGFTANPADFNASNTPGAVFQVSVKDTPKLYVFGIARDKNFFSYRFSMVGGQTSNALFICDGLNAGNEACIPDSVQVPDKFGYGMARSLSYGETLAPDELIDAYSDDVPLLTWNVGYLTPDAYALSLTVVSSAHVNGNDDPVSASTWATMLFTP